MSGPRRDHAVTATPCQVAATDYRRRLGWAVHAFDTAVWITPATPVEAFNVPRPIGECVLACGLDLPVVNIPGPPDRWSLLTRPHDGVPGEILDLLGDHDIGYAYIGRHLGRPADWGIDLPPTRHPGRAPLSWITPPRSRLPAAGIVAGLVVEIFEMQRTRRNRGATLGSGWNTGICGGHRMADGTGSMSDSIGNDQTPPDKTWTDQIQAASAQKQATDQANDPEANGGIMSPSVVGAKQRLAEARTTAAIGAGFKFTPAEIDLQIQHCQAQINDLWQDLWSAQDAAERVHEPAPDLASVTQANAVKYTLQNVTGVIRSDIAYLTDWLAKLNTAKQNYLTNEHLSEQQWTKLTKQGLDR